MGHIPGLYPPDAISTSPKLWQPQMSPDIPKYPLGRSIRPCAQGWEQLLQPWGTLHYQKSSQPADMYWVLLCSTRGSVAEGAEPRTWLTNAVLGRQDLRLRAEEETGDQRGPREWAAPGEGGIRWAGLVGPWRWVEGQRWRAGVLPACRTAEHFV